MRSLFIILLFILTACERSDKANPENLLSDGVLTVLTRNAPTTYFFDRNDMPSGFEFDLASAFAKHLGVQVRFEIKDSIGEILQALREGDGDLAAAGLTHTKQREPNYVFGPPYQKVRQEVVCRRGGKFPKNVEELRTVSLIVPSQSSYVERLDELKKNMPDLTWKAEEDLSTEQALEMVWERKIDCTVADSNIVAINRRYLPELRVAFPLTEDQPLAWVMPKDKTELRDLVSQWLNSIQKSKLSLIRERYYGHVGEFDYVDMKRFQRRIRSRLPKYDEYFQEAAKTHKLDWKLLAAQGYQESYWNPKSQSPTGVRGIMMLTLPTAEELGISNRLDPKQSIKGGAKYLAGLRKRLPKEIKEPNRTWFALAAYNVGMGHLRDARTLAQKLGRNPNLWKDLKETLPYLSQKKYYKSLRYGYARGYEPVLYIQRIRNYYDVLRKAL